MAISRAAIRTINILELIASKAKGITLSEIAIELEMPITSVSDIIKALIETDMIEVIDERSKLYGIGVKAYYIGNTFISNTTLVDKSIPIIDELSSIINKTVFLGKEVQEKITYLYKYEPKDTLVATCSIGSRTYLHSTSLGKCFLAHDEALLNKVLQMDLIKKTPYTITDHNELLEEIRKVRIQGYALDNREQDERMLCIGAPIFDQNNNIIAAISISGLYSEHINIEYESNIVREKALLISKKMGYTENGIRGLKCI